MKYTGQCPCGENQFEIHGEPIMRFYCHCTICQEKYDAPFVNAALFRIDDVHVSKGDAITYGKYKRFAAIDRGICDNCNKPVMAKAGEGKRGLAFVATQNFNNPEDLPPVNMHVFYGTRVEDSTDDLPKYKNWVTSQLAFIKPLMKVWSS